jgi:hypothetical protein
MKPLTVLNLSAAALLGLGISLGSADDRPEARYIKLWPDLGGIGSMLPHAPTVRASTKEKLTGTVAHVIAYVERKDADGGVAFDPDAKQMFIFPTTSGRYVVRVLDVPAGHGWYGPF